MWKQAIKSQVSVSCQQYGVILKHSHIRIEFNMSSCKMKAAQSSLLYTNTHECHKSLQCSFTSAESHADLDISFQLRVCL